MTARKKRRGWQPNTSWLVGIAGLALAVPAAVVLAGIVVASELASVEWGPEGEAARRK